MSRMIYLAYPIDANPDRKALALVDHAKAMLQSKQAVGLIFDPGDAFAIANTDLLRGRGGAIREINRLAATLADDLFVFLPKGVDTVGVPMEIERAVAQGKTIWLFTDRESMYMMPGQVNSYPLDAEGVNNAITAMLTMTRNFDPPESETQPLPFKLLAEEARLPTRAYTDDAGFDLYTVGFHAVHPGEFVDIPLGVAVELPPQIWGNLVGRSSTWRNLGLSVVQGIIDPGYRGPLFVGVHNPSDEEVEVPHGSRIAQLILMGNPTRLFSPMEISELAKSPRGERGFGSSGA